MKGERINRIIQSMTKKKNRSMIYWQYPIVIIGGALLFYFVTKYNKAKLEKAPKFDFEQSIDSLYVEEIDFPRGSLYINGIMYNAFGISSYSKIHSKKESTILFELPPPFLMTKEANNDTLKIIKDGKQYYLLISEERRLW